MVHFCIHYPEDFVGSIVQVLGVHLVQLDDVGYYDACNSCGKKQCDHSGVGTKKAYFGDLTMADASGSCSVKGDLAQLEKMGASLGQVMEGLSPSARGNVNESWVHPSNIILF